MIGRRRPDGNEREPRSTWQPGDYWRHTDGDWCAVTPNGLPVSLRDAASIEEHEDGTITVTPSIQMITSGRARYEGTLTRGVWSEG